MFIRHHISRIGLQLGKRLALGGKRYRAKGYHASNFVLNASEKHEADILALLERRLPLHKGAFLDVGVNIGQTLWKVLSLDPGREYYGFEPLLSCCADVSAFAEANSLRNIHILPIGLSNENRIATFYSRGPSDTMASLMANEACERSVIQVRRGDDVVDELGICKVGVIKVDVEGAEWRVFQGFKRTLTRDRPFLIFEILPNFVGHQRDSIAEEQAAGNCARLEKLQEVLADCGYRVFRLQPGGREALAGPIDLSDKHAYVSNDFTAEYHPLA